MTPATSGGLPVSETDTQGWNVGYSAAGEVIAVGEGIDDLAPGDLVACAGDDLRRVDPAELGADRAGVDPRHFQDVLEQPRQPLDLGEHQRALIAPLVVGQP